MKFYDYTRKVQLDLSIGDDTALVVSFDAQIDDDRIIINCDTWKVQDAETGHIRALSAADTLKLEQELEGMSRSIIAEWAQSMAEWQAEGQYHGNLN